MQVQKALDYAHKLLLKLKDDYNNKVIDEITLTSIMLELSSSRSLPELKSEIDSISHKYPVLIEFAFKDKLFNKINKS